MPRLACAAIAMLALALRAADTAPCPNGVTKPTITTIMASRDDPEKVALVVDADCVSNPVKIAGSGVGFSKSMAKSEIDRVDSLPSGLKEVTFTTVRLSNGADFSGATNLKTISIKEFGPELVDNLRLPSQLDKLVMASSAVNSIDKVQLPDSLTALNLVSLTLTSLKSIPSRLRELELDGNWLSSITFAMPATLESLAMNMNPMAKLDRITFPDNLKEFSCSECGITSVRGVKWPRQLTKLNLGTNKIVVFELRQSDFDAFNGISEFTVSVTQETCADKFAEMKETKSQKFCVISDDRFEALYAGDGSPTDPPSSGSSGTDTGSSGEPGDDSTGSEGSNALSNNNRTSDPGSFSGDGSLPIGSDARPSSSKIDTNRSTSSTSSEGTKDATEDSPSSPRSNSTVVTVLIAVGCFSAVLVVVLIYRRFRAARRHRDKDTLLEDTQVSSNSQAPSDSNGGSSQEYLSNDIRNDKALIPFRIDKNEISLSKQIARGGFGVIYHGVYSGRAVAVKQMLPDAWRNEAQLASFMDEIRLCASLSHPKIVEFIGVSWSSLRDISVIIEFMEGGDLHSVLAQHARAQSPSATSPVGVNSSVSLSASPFSPSPRDWAHQWTAASINSKTLVAKDVAEAVVYLHSFLNPVVHRDLKARNVLLDPQGNAKLSDFGISRELAVDETMTSEVGTSAWIAPEVLRGDRYSERADMYSFGVLLVELDKCRHPYADEGVLDGGADSVRMAVVMAGRQPDARISTRVHQSVQHQNMQIAMLVSAGHLRPKPSASCPARVQALIARCLSFEPEDRPSAIEVHYELRQILAELEASE